MPTDQSTILYFATLPPHHPSTEPYLEKLESRQRLTFKAIIVAESGILHQKYGLVNMLSPLGLSVAKLEKWKVFNEM
jgi:hypothetical protein